MFVLPGRRALWLASRRACDVPAACYQLPCYLGTNLNRATRPWPAGHRPRFPEGLRQRGHAPAAAAINTVTNKSPSFTPCPMRGAELIRRNCVIRLPRRDIAISQPYWAVLESRLGTFYVCAVTKSTYGMKTFKSKMHKRLKDALVLFSSRDYCLII